MTKKIIQFALIFTSIYGFGQNLKFDIESISKEIDGISDYKIISFNNSQTTFVSSLNGTLYYNTDNTGWQEFEISNIDIEQINAFDVTNEGVIYIATQDQGIIYGSGPEMNIYDNSVDEIIINRFVDVLYDDEDALWALDSRGRLFKLKNGEWRNFTEEPMGTLDDLEFLYLDSFGDVWAIGEDVSDEHISDNEFNRYYFILAFGGGKINSVSQDSEEKFWISTRKGPLVHLKSGETEDRAEEITENRGTTHIVNINNELVWLSLRFGGVMVWNENTNSRMIFERDDYPELPEDVVGMWLNDDQSISIIALDNPNIITLKLEPVSTIEVERQNFTVYPNPTEDIIHFDVDSDFSEVVLIDQLGRKFNKTLKEDKSLDVSELNKGMYYIKCVDKSSNILGSFVKIN